MDLSWILIESNNIDVLYDCLALMYGVAAWASNGSGKIYIYTYTYIHIMALDNFDDLNPFVSM